MPNKAKTGDLDPFGRVWTLKGDLRQRDVAVWNRAYLNHPYRAALADERQAALQAAIEAGWILSPAVAYEDVTAADGKTRRRYIFDGVEVDDMTAAEVARFATRILRIQRASQKPDPRGGGPRRGRRTAAARTGLVAYARLG